MTDVSAHCEHDKEQLYSKERILTVLSRVLKPGGIPLDDKIKKHTACWVRGLALRGFADVSLLRDGVAANRAFAEAFSNPPTRGQYARAITTYIGGLTDAEFEMEYPDMTRDHIVRLMKDVTIDAGKEGKEKKTQRRARGDSTE
jgi:hypothetical protein